MLQPHILIHENALTLNNTHARTLTSASFHLTVPHRPYAHDVTKQIVHPLMEASVYHCTFHQQMQTAGWVPRNTRVRQVHYTRVLNLSRACHVVHYFAAKMTSRDVNTQGLYIVQKPRTHMHTHKYPHYTHMAASANLHHTVQIVSNI